LLPSLRQIVGRILTGQPGRDALRLGARLIGARAMSVVTLFVAAWLVDIEAFAEFGVYQTLAALAWVALFLRYEAAILAAYTEEEAGEAMRLCVAVGAFLWLAFTCASLAAGGAGFMRMEFALLLPLSILARGMLRLASAAANRDGDFKGMGRASLVQSVVQPTVLLALVLSPVEDALSFAVADVVGHASGVAYLGYRHRHRFGALRRGWSRKALVALAQQRRDLPLYNLPSSFFSVAFVMSPLLIMPVAADASFAGHVALAYRIFDVPTQIITAASTPIFLSRLRPSKEGGSALFGRHIMLGLTIVVGLAYALMAGLLISADPWLVGTELDGLAEAVPMVTLFQLFVALGAPLNDSCALYPQQKRLVLIQGVALVGSALLLALAGRVSPECVLLWLSAVSAMRTLALGELLHRLSRLSRRAFRKTSSGAHVAPHEGVDMYSG